MSIGHLYLIFESRELLNNKKKQMESKHPKIKHKQMPNPDEKLSFLDINVCKKKFQLEMRSYCGTAF